ncbi:monooxygenase 2-like [Tasmannia lanceolata]|uniref:monooxygenase 2-like n=1 Tax=Tasmannia lanceolata TaxID=3420 RepID=UPI0040628BEC
MEICEEVVIVGGGIAGLATAVALKRVGVRALVLERSDELRATGAALTLFPNAWRALHALGVAHKLNAIYSSLTKGTVTNLVTGATETIVYADTPDGDKLGVRAVHRKALLEALAEELPSGTIRFSSKLASVKTQTLEGSPNAVLHMEDDTTIKAKVLIGCDGVHSVMAQWLGLVSPVHAGRWSVRSLAIYPEGHGFNQEIQSFLSDGKRAGLVPLNDKEFYWFINYKSSHRGEGAGSDPKLIQKDVIENLAKDYPPIFLDVVRHADLATLTATPLLFRYPWDLIFGNLCKGNVTVAGDAMHPMTPDLGQGGCSALEDAVVLGRHIRNSLLRDGSIRYESVGQVLESYVKERRWRVAGLIAGSYISGWVRQGGSGLLVNFMKMVYYRFLYARVLNASNYDCGDLPAVFSTDSA